MFVWSSVMMPVSLYILVLYVKHVDVNWRQISHHERAAAFLRT